MARNRAYEQSAGVFLAMNDLVSSLYVRLTPKIPMLRMTV